MVAILALLLVVPPVGAQQQTDSLVQRQLEYTAALSAYEAAIAARDALRPEHESLLARVRAARQGGSQRAYEDAQQGLYSFLPELAMSDRRVAATEGRVEAAREALLEALDARRERLEERLLTAAPAERGGIAALIRDLENQYDELDREREEFEATPAFSSVDFDPRDDARSLQAKAGVLERQAREAEILIDEITDEIERLEGRLRLERQNRDFAADRDRFDANRVPVGTPTRTRSSDDGPVPADSVPVPLSDLPIPERIERLKEYRVQMQTYRAFWLERAELFLARIRGDRS